MLKICKVFSMVVTVLLFFVAGHAQNKSVEEVFTESWQKGSETITNQQMELILSAENKNYQTLIFGKSGKKFKLSVNFLPISKNPLSTSGKTTEGWQVELCEVKVNEKNEEELGANLLTKTRMESNRDYFPKEDMIGYLMFEGTETFYKRHYPIETIRKIKVEGFYVFINVKDYQINTSDKHKIDYLKVLIELKNECKKS